MTTINAYFDNILNTKGFEAWEEANAELVALVEEEETAWVNGEDLTLVADWAKTHNIDLTAGRMLAGSFVTYYQSWYWDNIEG